MYNLTGIYWIKDEARYIPEYIEFHLLQGFDHFIFYDNQSSDNLLEVIKPYIDRGLVEIRYYPEDVKTRKNFWLMDHCIVEQRGKSKWVHYHALDERLYCPDGRMVTELLDEYENYGGLSVGWELYNSSGHVKRPNGLIIENFIRAIHDEHCHIKTIIQPEKTLNTIGTPHNFNFNNTHSVDENFNMVINSFNPVNYSLNKIKLNHYVTLSREEFDIKMNKGLLDVSQENERRVHAESQWDFMENTPTFENTYLLEKYTSLVRENILITYQGNEHLLQFINH